MRSTISLLILSLCVVALAACGSDDKKSSSGGGAGGGGGGGAVDIDTGLEGSAAMNSFSAAEIQAACDKALAQAEAAADAVMVEYADDLKEGGCTMAGMMAAAFAPAGTDATAACEEARTACMSAPAEGEEEPEEEDTCAGDLADCTATVDEVEACVSDQISADLASIKPMATAMAAMSCDDAGEPGEMGEEPAETPDPASCTAIKDKCPALLEEAAAVAVEGEGEGEGGGEGGGEGEGEGEGE